MPTKNKVKEQTKKIKPFRIRAYKYALTYPDLPDFEFIHRLFLTIIGYQLEGTQFADKISFLSSKEKHESGTKHVHMYLEFKHRKDLYNANALEIDFNNIYELQENNPNNKMFSLPFLEQDLKSFLPIFVKYTENRKGNKDAKQGKEGIFKGNYGGVRNKQNTLAYFLKDVPNLQQSELVHTNMHNNLPMVKGEFFKNMEDHLLALVDQSGYSAAAEALFKIYPKEAVRRGQSILKNLQMYEAYNRDKELWLNTIIYPLPTFRDIPVEVKNWIEAEHTTKTLILHGPPKTGKTELAKSILTYYLKLQYQYKNAELSNTRFLMVTDFQDLRKFQGEIFKSILYDDIDLQDLSRTQKISILDTANPQTHRVLYGSITIPGSVPRIVCTNNINDLLTDTKNHNPARLGELERRCKIINIEKPVFDEQAKLLRTTINEMVDKPLVNIEQYKFEETKPRKEDPLFVNRGPLEPHIE